MCSEISSTTLSAMKAAYLQHPNRLKTAAGADLKGFSLPVSELQQVIQPGVTDVFVMFGVRPDDLNKPQDQQYFTLAFAGVDSDNNLRTELIFDYCDPCPDKCPAGY